MAENNNHLENNNKSSAQSGSWVIWLQPTLFYVINAWIFQGASEFELNLDAPFMGWKCYISSGWGGSI